MKKFVTTLESLSEQKPGHLLSVRQKPLPRVRTREIK
jgi:hypothetical protein